MSISDNQGVQDYKFTGKELDMMNGLNFYDFEARTYDPATGRFLSVDPMAEKYYHISPYLYCAGDPVNATDPTGKWIKGTDGKPVTYKNGKWSSNASADVQKIGNAMMLSEEGRNVLNDMFKTKYSISLNYKEGFHPEDRDKSGEARIEYNKKTKEIIEVTINLFDGKINEDVSYYKQISEAGEKLTDADLRDLLMLEHPPTLTERIGQVGAHEGTHATKKKAMPYMVGISEAEKFAFESEMRAMRGTMYNVPVNTPPIAPANTPSTIFNKPLDIIIHK
jgi:RHS repeat-associated protein